MHIPDGFIDGPTSLAAGGLAAVGLAVAGRRAGRELTERRVPLAGLLGAYVLVAQLMVFPVGLGTSAHLIGATLAAVLVGPWVATVCVAVVLAVQAFLFADGGVSALGLNLINDGLVPVFVGYGVAAAALRCARSDRSRRPRRLGTAAGAGSAVAVLAAALALSVEYAIGGTDTLGAAEVAVGMGASHLVVAAVEGTLTALLVTALARVRPDLVYLGRRRSPAEPRAVATGAAT